MLKKLIKHGNSRAIVVDKALLDAAGISENTLFQITINPSGGLVIQSVTDDKTELFQKKFEGLNQRYKKLMKNLAEL
jgi:antitoxin component of MazEF toxin-antitoxin module